MTLALPIVSLKESQDSLSDDGTGERTGGEGKTGCSSSCLGIPSFVGSPLTGLGGIPFTLSAQLFPLPALKGKDNA